MTNLLADLTLLAGKALLILGVYVLASSLAAYSRSRP